MAKLWQKDYSVNALLEEFTVGRDYELDIHLIESDCLASMAHAKMLSEIGILNKEEYQSLRRELYGILQSVRLGEFEVLPSDEDGHTAIENRLTAVLGETGKKIHTGRSRNDQVITALRVFSRGQINTILQNLYELTQNILSLAEKHKATPMPGRTHMQVAMPSSVALWLGSFMEELIDGAAMIKAALGLIDQSSLGSAASYGVPLPLDRSRTAELLGFAKVQNNVLYVNNSRGKYESIVLDALDQIGLTLSKMAQDLMIFSLPEFGYFSLPDELCTGSSIMPQKKNPDGLELLRAKAGSLGGYASQIKNVIRSLPTGYNRDFQETKEPYLRGLLLADQMIRVMNLTVEKLAVNAQKLEAGFSKDIFATDAAYELVMEGQSFRDAYKEVGLNLDKLGDYSPAESLKSRKLQGGSANLGLDLSQERIQKGLEECEALESHWLGAFRKLTEDPEFSFI